MKPQNIAGMSLVIPVIIVPYVYSHFFNEYWTALNRSDRGVCPTCQSIVTSSEIIPAVLAAISMIIAFTALHKMNKDGNQKGMAMARIAVICDLAVLVFVLIFTFS